MGQHSSSYQSIKKLTKAETFRAIANLKKRATIEHLTKGLPIEMKDLYFYVRSLEFYEKPDYNYIRSNLRASLSKSTTRKDFLYDWNQLPDES